MIEESYKLSLISSTLLDSSLPRSTELDSEARKARTDDDALSSTRCRRASSLRNHSSGKFLSTRSDYFVWPLLASIPLLSMMLFRGYRLALAMVIGSTILVLVLRSLTTGTSLSLRRTADTMERSTEPQQEVVAMIKTLVVEAEALDRTINTALQSCILEADEQRCDLCALLLHCRAVHVH